MQRPLPPFRVKPLRSVLVRRVIDIGTIRDMAFEEPMNIKPARQTLKTSKPDPSARLKVLGRTANDQE